VFLYMGLWVPVNYIYERKLFCACSVLETYNCHLYSLKLSTILPSQYCIVSQNYDNSLADMHVEGPIIPERSCPTQTSKVFC
jgi:hypothetical protein